MNGYGGYDVSHPGLVVTGMPLKLVASDLSNGLVAAATTHCCHSSHF